MGVYMGCVRVVLDEDYVSGNMNEAEATFSLFEECVAHAEYKMLTSLMAHSKKNT